MIKTLTNILKQDKEKFKVPRSVQDALPIQRLWADGIFKQGTKYSKTLRFSDINYAIASKEDKTAMFLGYSDLLNALDTGATTKLTIQNKHINRKRFEETILLPMQGDDLDVYRQEYNQMLVDKIRSLLRRRPLVPDMRLPRNLPGRHERRKMQNRQRSA